MGAAVLQDGRLTGAWWLRVEVQEAQPCLVCARARKACGHTEAGLRRWLMLRQLRRVAGEMDAFNLVVTEGQYVPFGGGLNPQALLPLAQCVGAVSAAATLAGTSVAVYNPKEWKGNRAKDQHQARILACLTLDELELVPRAPKTRRYLSDPVDAVGLGLYAVGRTTPRRDPHDYLALVDPAPKKRGAKT